MIRMIRRTLFGMTALVAILALAGCTTDALMLQLQQTPLIQTEALAPVDVPVANRLLVLDSDGNVVTVDPDGTDRFALTTDASTTRQYLQPTWSPGAQLIAWTEVETGGEEQLTKLVTVSFDGAYRAEAEVPFAPFYIFWSPLGDKLAYLSNWDRFSVPSMALRVADIPVPAAESTDAAPTLDVRTVAEGSPFYFSWNPGGDRLVTHVGNETLQLQDLDGARTALAEQPGDFPAPHWTREGERLVYAVTEDGLQRLVIAGLDGTVEKELTDFSSRIAFAVNTDASQAAYVVTDAAVTMAALGPLYVVDMETLATRELTDRPTVAFFWSPDGQKLAYMTVENGTSGLRFRWWVWDGVTNRDFGAYLPSRLFFQSYLAFFDQYAQSMNLWSPDSSAFAYPGMRDRLSGIWVQQLEEEAPRWIGRGTFVAWSPQ